MGTTNIGIIIQNLEKGMMLSPEELVNTAAFLRGCRKLKGFMLTQTFFASVLSSYANSISTFKEIEEEINFTIKGNHVDSAASKELRKIRKSIEATEDKINERMNKFLTSSTHKKYIQEFFISKKMIVIQFRLKHLIKIKLLGRLLRSLRKVLQYSWS